LRRARVRQRGILFVGRRFRNCRRAAWHAPDTDLGDLVARAARGEGQWSV